MPARGFDSFRVPSMMVGFDSQQTGGGASLYKNNGHCSSFFGVFDLRGVSHILMVFTVAGFIHCLWFHCLAASREPTSSRSVSLLRVNPLG